MLVFFSNGHIAENQYLLTFLWTFLVKMTYCVAVGRNSNIHTKF